MRHMTNERQLAAVLGHEVAHVSEKHNVMAIEREMGASVLAQVIGAVLGGTAGSAAEAGTKVTGAMVNLNYSRGAESEADEVGLRYLVAAGYDPWSMVELLTVLLELSERPFMLGVAAFG